MNRRSSNQAVLVVVALAAGAGVAAGGCADEFHDDAFGVLETESTYEGSTPANPTAGLPERIEPQRGFEAGERAEYYDFGPVPTVDSPETGAPVTARIAPMYFFFSKSGLPLFSMPVRELRDGTDHLRGGKDVLSPNPKKFCVPGADPIACDALDKQAERRPYGVRYRERLVDPLRNVDDYQRPVVDLTPADGVRGNRLYTGLWEIIEVTVPNGYAPDAIKHKKTLEAALDSGDFKSRATGKVINCPIIDERTAVPIGITDRTTPHPRMEIWYRRKLAFCYLANGWLTLGTPDGQRYPAGNDAQRLDTFDVSRVKVGEGKTESTVLVVPVGRAYTPNVFTRDNRTGFSETRVAEQIVSLGRPRGSPADPPGYTPIRWMWDVIIEGTYVEDSFKTVSELDDFQVNPRGVSHNLPLRGVAVPCSYPKLLKTIDGVNVEQCGVDRPGPGGFDVVVDSSGDPNCTPLGLECNKDTCTCDAPPVSYGQRCGFGIARCSEEEHELSKEGFTCFPRTVGFCHLRCDPRDKNTLAKQNEGREPKDFVDSRCDGLSGYNCFPYGRSGICLKFCDANILDNDTSLQCGAIKQATNPVTRLVEDYDLGATQICQNYGIQICTWPDDFAGY